MADIKISSIPEEVNDHIPSDLFECEQEGSGKKTTLQKIFNAVLQVLGAKLFAENTLQIQNSVNGEVATFAYIEEDNSTAVKIPFGLDDGNGNYVGTMQYVENMSNDATSGSKSASKYITEQAAKTYSESLVVGLLDDRGNYDASSNAFPTTGGSGTSGAIKKGDLWLISAAGTLGGTAVAVKDTIRALVDTPGQTSGKWGIINGQVISSLPFTEAVFLISQAGGTADPTLIQVSNNTGKTFTTSRANNPGFYFIIANSDFANKDKVVASIYKNTDEDYYLFSASLYWYNNDRVAIYTSYLNAGSTQRNDGMLNKARVSIKIYP